MYDNIEAWQLWNSLKTQWRTSFGGVVGIDYTAIPFVSDSLDIVITPNMLQKIKALEYATLRSVKEREAVT
jgi:hypothetical protein